MEEVHTRAEQLAPLLVLELDSINAARRIRLRIVMRTLVLSSRGGISRLLVLVLRACFGTVRIQRSMITL